MAWTKISELTELTNPTWDEELVYAKDWENGKIKVSNLFKNAANTNTFYLADYYDLTTAQAAYDWIASWNNAIIVYENETYIYDSDDGNGLLLVRRIWKLWHYNSPQFSQTDEVFLKISYNNWVVTLISPRVLYTNVINFLSTTTDYTTPYVPRYDWSPATKKYVDDLVGDIETLLANI